MSGGDGSGAAKRVLADAQASLIFTLRPYPHFEDTYQGVAAFTPIMFTDGGEPLDPQAGKFGYSPNLVRGLPVPMGARVLVWLPMSGEPGVSGIPEVYNWTFIWRIRSVADFRQARMAYHYPKQGPGVTTTFPDVDPGPRFILPAAINSVIYQDPGPRQNVFSGTGAPVTEMTQDRVMTQTFQPQRMVETFSDTVSLEAPILPGAVRGIVEQGISDSFASAFSDLGMPIYVPVDVTALGDELLIACWKPFTNLVQNTLPANWDFNATDFQFSLLFGQGGTGQAQPVAIDLGVYVSIINAP